MGKEENPGKQSDAHPDTSCSFSVHSVYFRLFSWSHLNYLSKLIDPLKQNAPVVKEACSYLRKKSFSLTLNVLMLSATPSLRANLYLGSPTSIALVTLLFNHRS